MCGGLEGSSTAAQCILCIKVVLDAHASILGAAAVPGPATATAACCDACPLGSSSAHQEPCQSNVMDQPRYAMHGTAVQPLRMSHQL